MFSGLEVVQVFLVLICFAFETDSFVCRAGMEYQSEKPLKEVDDIEEHIKQFLHLRRMDCLVIDVNIFHLVNQFFPYEKYSEQIDKAEPLEGDDVVWNQFHYIT